MGSKGSAASVDVMMGGAGQGLATAGGSPVHFADSQQLKR